MGLRGGITGQGDAALAAFSEPAAAVLEIGRKLAPTLDGRSYAFMRPDRFRVLVREHMIQVYWQEMLSRAHWAGATATLRALRWADGVSSALTSTNAVSFAACCRGFLEAAADTNYSLNPIASTLAREHSVIRDALRAGTAVAPLSQDVEDRLIHFIYARRRSGDDPWPTTHDARTVREYLRSISGGLPAVESLYTMLCDLTHPGFLSTATVADHHDDAVTITPAAELKVLQIAVKEFRAVSEILVGYGAMVPLLLLKTLNEFPYPASHTPFLRHIDFEPIPSWQKLRALLERS